MVDALLISLAVIFIAELGDKSQLMALVFASRYRAGPVLAGITIATAVVHAASVGLGAALGAVLPVRLITALAALAFVGFGLWTLRGDELTEDEQRRADDLSGRSALVAVGVAFFLAELGDKTMLATVTLATDEGGPGAWFGTWLGSTVGMVAADGLAIVVGQQLGTRLPERAVRIGAAVCFFAVAAWLGLDAAIA